MSATLTIEMPDDTSYDIKVRTADFETGEVELVAHELHRRREDVLVLLVLDVERSQELAHVLGGAEPPAGVIVEHRAVLRCEVAVRPGVDGGQRGAQRVVQSESVGSGLADDELEPGATGRRDRRGWCGGALGEKVRALAPVRASAVMASVAH